MDTARLQWRKAKEETARVVEGIRSPDQSARLKQIHLQWLSHCYPTSRILVLPQMLSALRISEEQQEQLERLAEQWQSRNDVYAADPELPAEERKRIEQLRKTEVDQATGILDPQQRKEFEAMKGPDFYPSEGF